MATNQIQTTDLVLAVGLTSLKYLTPFTQTTRNYSDYFGSFSTKSKKTGLSIDVPIPPRLVVGGSRGSLDSSYSAQDYVEPVTPLAIDTYRKVHTEFESIESALELQNFAKNVMQPGYRAMASVIDSDNSSIINKFGRAVLAGSTGVDIDDAGDALSILMEYGTPRQNLKLMAPQSMHSSFTNNTSNLFNPQKTISMQYLDGYVGNAQGFEWMISELLPSFANGTANAGSFDSATGLTPLGVVASLPANGANTLSISGITTDGTIKAGTIIQIAGTDAVNGYTYLSTGRTRQFCVDADVTSSTNAAVVTVTEQFIDGSGTNESASLQNVTQLPQATNVVSILGEVGTSYKQAFAYHTDAVIHAFCKLTMPSAGAKATQDVKEGMYMRSLETFDYDIDSNINRLDAAFGRAVGRNEFGVRILEKIG